jgi:N-acylglucosamine-6-phosphate 2-epimerase
MKHNSIPKFEGGARIIEIIEQLRDGLIVSCQALEDEPLHGSSFMAAMAKAAQVGGAKGIRANGPDDIAAIRQAVDLPVIGIFKQFHPQAEVYITPTFDSAQAVVKAGADIVALDATPRLRPDHVEVSAMINRIKAELGVPVLADISTLEEGIAAAEMGADLIATTLVGHTPYTAHQREFDTEIIRTLAQSIKVPVIAEGGLWSPDEALRALEAGALAVVVGSAITRPQLITKRFVKKLQKYRKGEPNDVW